MSNGQCAQDGTSAAVDGTVIPRRSEFSVAGDGTRTAQDTGGGIRGYHIDEFFGTRRAACLQAGRRTLGVDFLSY
jgi:3D (Asp-Asp-Asp) domain-containing protein